MDSLYPCSGGCTNFVNAAFCSVGAREVNEQTVMVQCAQWSQDFVAKFQSVAVYW